MIYPSGATMWRKVLLKRPSILFRIWESIDKLRIAATTSAAMKLYVPFKPPQPGGTGGLQMSTLYSWGMEPRNSGCGLETYADILLQEETLTPE